MKPETNKLNVSKKQWFAIAVIAAVGIGLAAPFSAARRIRRRGATSQQPRGSQRPTVMVSIIMARQADSHEDDKGHADGEHHEGSSKGPHGGKLFKEGDFGLEALLAEDGGEPRLRIWLYEKGKALASSAAKVSATITRLTGEKQALNFARQGQPVESRGCAGTSCVRDQHRASDANAPSRSVQPGGRKSRTQRCANQAASIGIDTAGLHESSLPCNCRVRLA